MRVVFDTNTVISALLFRGAASWLLEHWQRDEVTPLLNHQTAHELLQVLIELLAIRLSAIKHLEEVLVPVSANSTRGCVLSRWS